MTELFQSKNRVFVAAGCAIAILAASAHAQDSETPPPVDAGTQSVLPEVTVKAAEIRESAYGPVEGYRAERTGTATKTDTAIREIPAAIQVVPKQVIEDQQATGITEAVQNVSSVRAGSTFGNRGDSFIIRGFQTFLNARDGFVSNQLFGDPGFIDLANVERIEVLKGPASVLYGLGDPGGLVNIVTKRPLREAQYEVTAQAGSYAFYRAQADISQPLNADGSLALRVTGAHQDWDSYRDFFRRSQRTFVAPVLGWEPDASTTVLVDFEYVDQELPFDRGLVALGTGVAPVPISRYFGEEWSTFELSGTQTRYIVEHAVNETWLVRQTGRYQESESRRHSADPRGLQADNRTLNRRARDQRDSGDQWSLQLEAVGDYTRAYVGHKLLLGMETGKARKEVLLARVNMDPIDIFDPVYGAQPVGLGEPTLFSDQEIRYTGLYAQDQVWLGERWKLLLGLRYDETRHEATISGNTAINEDEEVSPRAGIMYDLTSQASLYAAYSRSFIPTSGTAFDGTPFEPQTGEQAEVGVKADFLDRRLSATLALYDLKRQNLTTADPDNPGFSVQTGEQRARGVELDVYGDFGSGWSVIAAAAYTDAELTEDNRFTPGNRIQGVPRYSGSLWVTREARTGDWRGFGVGAGVFAAGEREGDLGNTYRVPGYARVDASVFYRGDGWRATFGVKNVLDKEYIESPVSRTEIYPGAPRTLLATVEATL